MCWSHKWHEEHLTVEYVSSVQSVKGKGGPFPMVSLGGVLISLTWARARRWINHKV